MAYVIRARFTGRPPQHLASMVTDGFVYLGKRGHWAPIEKALRFRTRAAAELILDEKWERLQRAGERTIILSIAQLSPAGLKGEVDFVMCIGFLIRGAPGFELEPGSGGRYGHESVTTWSKKTRRKAGLTGVSLERPTD